MSQVTSCKQDPVSKAMGAVVRMRSDLKISRQLSHGAPAYVLQDPVSFGTHRLTAFQYRVLTALDPNEPLSRNFENLVAREDFEDGEEELFLQLISTYRRLGLLVAPASGEELYKHSQKIRSAKTRGKILGALFMQIPLVAPDAFLQRTIHLFSWLFTRWFLAVWFVGLAAAATVVANRFSEFAEPLNGLLATKNLPFLWFSFVVLKVWHELGHGYACKRFGGFVPEMGTILIAGTPAAYIDASSAWNFPEKRRRLAVMCGGMFFESLILIPAVFVWAFASNNMLASCAYQLVILTSISTILFNANPLMRFDGYYILSELIGIQNLRQRADVQIKGLMSRVALGLKPRPTGDSFVTRCLLLLYGVSASIYRFFLVFSIALMVATRFPVIGLALAAFHVITSMASSAYKMLNFLLASPATAQVRTRARMVAALVFLGVPAALTLLPMPTAVSGQGLVSSEREYFVNVDSPGEFPADGTGQNGQVTAGMPMVTLSNDGIHEALRTSQATLAEARTRWMSALEVGPHAGAWEKTTVVQLQREVNERRREVDRLTVEAPENGTVVWRLPETERGRFLTAGTPIARIASGEPLIRSWVSEEQLGSIDATTGGVAEFRIPGRSNETYLGMITSLQAVSEEVFQHPALTQLTGGEVLVDPGTGRPLIAVFQIEISPFDKDVLRHTEFNARVELRLPRQRESIGGWLYRRCIRFTHSLLSV